MPYDLSPVASAIDDQGNFWLAALAFISCLLVVLMAIKPAPEKREVVETKPVAKPPATKPIASNIIDS